MSLDHILLGLLRRPASGYDLKARFDNEIRYFWAAELSQIYSTLQRLERSGLLRSRVEASAKGPDRRVYALTAAGRRALKEWLACEPMFGTERFAYLAQLYFMGAARDLNRTLWFITDLKRTLTERLRTFKQIQSEWTGDDPDYFGSASVDEFHQYLALRAGILTMTARIEWCVEAIEEIRDRMGRREKQKRSRGSRGTVARTKKRKKGTQR